MSQHPSEKVRTIILKKAMDLRAATLEALYQHSVPPRATTSQPRQATTAASTSVVTKMAANGDRTRNTERKKPPPPARIDAQC